MNQGTRAQLVWAMAKAWAHNQGRTLWNKARKWTIMKRLYAPARIYAWNTDPPSLFELENQNDDWIVKLIVNKYQIILQSSCVNAGGSSFTVSSRWYDGKSFADLSIKSDFRFKSPPHDCDDTRLQRSESSPPTLSFAHVFSFSTFPLRSANSPPPPRLYQQRIISAYCIVADRHTILAA